MRVAIVLAAGASRRFGRGNKLLAHLWGRPLLLHALDRARASGARRIIVVTGSDRGRVTRLLRTERGIRPTVVRAVDHAEGMGASLRAGLAAMRPIEREALIFLGDMPLAIAPRRLRLRAGIDALRPEGRGHPMLVRAAVARLAADDLRDRGLAAALDPARIGTVCGRAGNRLDIDRRAALAAVRHGSRMRRPRLA